MFVREMYLGDRDWRGIATLKDLGGQQLSVDTVIEAIRLALPARDLLIPATDATVPRWSCVALIGKNIRGDERTMSVGRCTQDRFTCRTWSEFEGEQVLLDPSVIDDELLPVFLGQHGTTPKRWTVPFNEMSVAVRRYCLDGLEAPELVWEPV